MSLDVRLDGDHERAIRRMTRRGDSFASTVRRLIDQELVRLGRIDMGLECPDEPAGMSWRGLAQVSEGGGYLYISTRPHVPPVEVPFLGECS